MFKATLTSLAISIASSQEVFVSQEARLLQPGGGPPSGAQGASAGSSGGQGPSGQSGSGSQGG